MPARTSKKRDQGSPPLAQGGTEQHRLRILKAALHLLSAGGRDALTTRAVAEAARVQPPVLYRLFRDKASLLEAVAEYGFGLYLARKRHPASGSTARDPAEALRQGWRLHVDFGLEQPVLYLLMYAGRPGEQPHPTATRTYAQLLTFLTEVAASGRLLCSVEEAAHLCHSAACGTVISLLNTPAPQRDLHYSDLACEMVIAAILSEVAPALPSPLRGAVVTLGAQLAESAAGSAAVEVLSPAERLLLLEWLGRLQQVPPGPRNA